MYFRSFYIHSSIADIYIAPLQVGLLRSAPNSNEAKRCCFKLLKKFLGEYSRKLPEDQWETTPEQRSNYEESPALRGRGASKWDMKEALLSRTEVAGTPSSRGRAAKVSK